MGVRKYPQTNMAVETWQHFKGKRYTVMGTSQHTESLETFVVYADEFGWLWARPAAQFFGTVNVNGVKVPRFIRIGQ